MVRTYLQHGRLFYRLLMWDIERSTIATPWNRGEIPPLQTDHGSFSLPPSSDLHLTSFLAFRGIGMFLAHLGGIREGLFFPTAALLTHPIAHSSYQRDRSSNPPRPAKPRLVVCEPHPPSPPPTPSSSAFPALPPLATLLVPTRRGRLSSPFRSPGKSPTILPCYTLPPRDFLK